VPSLLLARAVLNAAEADDKHEFVDEAVRALTDLVESVDRANPDYAAYLDALGSARLLRFDRIGALEDLQAAASSATGAVAEARARDSLSAPALANLAGAL
jgi:hypothetical protein